VVRIKGIRTIPAGRGASRVGHAASALRYALSRRARAFFAANLSTNTSAPAPAHDLPLQPSTLHSPCTHSLSLSIFHSPLTFRPSQRCPLSRHQYAPKHPSPHPASLHLLPPCIPCVWSITVQKLTPALLDPKRPRARTRARTGTRARAAFVAPGRRGFRFEP
jgi:hypothetical protein